MLSTSLPAGRRRKQTGLLKFWQPILGQEKLNGKGLIEMGERLQAKILNAVSARPLSFWQLLKKLDSGELETIEALGKLRSKGLVSPGKKIKLKKRGQKKPSDNQNWNE